MNEKSEELSAVIFTALPIEREAVCTVTRGEVAVRVTLIGKNQGCVIFQHVALVEPNQESVKIAVFPAFRLLKIA